MKKLTLIIAIVLGLSMTTFADPDGGGLFQRGTSEETLYNRDGGSPMLVFPDLPGHGSEGNEPAPLGSGIALLTALGAAYAMSKRNKKD